MTNSELKTSSPTRTPFPSNQTPSELVHEFLLRLKESPFKGDIEESYAKRLMAATDNSLYQLMPSAIIFPKNHEDVERVMSLLAEPRFRSLSITPRGGGTGTNGQSLTFGLVLDLSRYMNNIISLDQENRTVTVQTGVVKDQLNAFLRPFGYFFAPELSTSNRATIGGMINTDASGQGSCEYGKTSQHVVELLGVYAGGKTLRTRSMERAALKELDEDSPLLKISQKLEASIAPHKEEIKAVFPPLNRYVTGYDLDHFAHDESFNLNHLLCGSEGTLGIFTEAVLNILPIPKETALVLISYDDFIEALADTPLLMKAEATSIEILDDIVLEIAKNDYIWATTEEYFEGIDYAHLKALQLIEFNADTVEELEERVERFMHYCNEHPNAHRLTRHAIFGKSAVNRVYGLRKRAVGLLGAVEGNRRPLPFVEDTAVPPENLAPFIAEFKAVLDQHQLRYGMFGHADAGVIHVRPALDMKLPSDRDLIRPISDAIYTLCEKYGGALWGEHGKGVRSEYSEQFFGALYPVIQSVKEIFDPYNQLNPGKIAIAPPKEGLPSRELYAIDGLPTRGLLNGQINQLYFETFPNTLYCNGNGACFNYDTDAAMCPSYKATRERINSPKGRSELIKEWLRQRTIGKVDPQFEAEMNESFSLCLSCKSCVGECPMKVDIPDAKAEFLHHYHQTHPRPKYHNLLAKAEEIAPLTAALGALYRPLAKGRVAKKITEKLGLIDLPIPQKSDLKDQIKRGRVVQLSDRTIKKLKELSDKEKRESVIIVPDVFLQFYDATTLNATLELLPNLGVTLYLAPYRPSGKVQHVLGYLEQFKRSALHQNQLLERLAESNIPLIGIEPPVTLLYRDEYRKKLGLNTPDVLLIQEWLFEYLSPLPPAKISALMKGKPKEGLQLLSHCTEKSNATHAPKVWQSIFALFNQPLTLTPTGCCGMSGSFGHVKENEMISRKIYHQSWKKVVDSHAPDTLLATGFSCRSQVERFSEVKVLHPIVYLNQLIKGV